MAAKKSDQADVVVALDPCVVYRDTTGRQVTVYQGAVIPREAVDSDHLALLEEQGIVGTPKEAEKAAADDSEA